MNPSTAPAGPRRSRALAAILSVAACAAAVGVAAMPSTAAVSVGHSGWYWGDPLPQGSDLRALELFGNRGYAAGDFGTVLRTDDAGGSWSGLRTGTTANLTDLDVIDDKTLVAGGGCSLRRSDDGGQTFERLPFTTSDARCTASVKSFDFVTPQAGYVLLDNGAVLQTTDGGESFAQRTAIPGTVATSAGTALASDVYFTAPGTGFAVTVQNGAGRIYRTTDSAGSWTLVASSARGLNAVHFTNPSVGYAVGVGNALLKTVDGGATWMPKALAGAPEDNELTDIRCSGTETCLISTSAGDRLLRTTDGGDTGSSVSPSTGRVYAVAFASSDRAVSVGRRGTTVVSDTAGVTFAPIGGRLQGLFTVLPTSLIHLRAESASTAYAPGTDGRIARTVDGGRSWTEIGVSTADNVIDMSFPRPQTGFALDSSGSALRTDNGGASWRILDTGTERRPRAIRATGPRQVLLIGPVGVRRSTNGGGQFASVRSKVLRRAQLDDVDGAGGATFAFGARSLVVSDDGGARWKRVPRPGGLIRDVDFVSRSTGYLLQENGRLFFTKNRGRRWTEVLALGTSQALAIAFGDAKHGFAVGGAPGEVQRTTDRGRSWQPQLIVGGFVRAVAAFGAKSGFVLADPPFPDPAGPLVTNSLFFGTDSGGTAGRPSELTIRAAATRVKRGGRVRISGRLKSAQGGENVQIAFLRGSGWFQRRVRVASNGAFSSVVRIKGTTRFVAQWRGDDARAGDGTEALTVKVGAPKRKKPVKRRRR